MIQSRELTYNGIHAEQSGQLHRAEEIYSQAVSVSPDDETARLKYAEALARRHSIPEAIQQMREAQRISHGDPAIIIRLGELHLANGDRRSALNAADAALAVDRKLPGAWALKGRVHASRGQHQDALSQYLRALTCDNENPEIRMEVARTYMRLGQYQRTLSNLDLLSRNYGRGKEPEQLVMLQCQAYSELDRPEESVTLLSELVAREEATSAAWNAYGQALADSGDMVNARLVLQTAAGRFPGETRLTESLARLQSVAEPVTMFR